MAVVAVAETRLIITTLTRSVEPVAQVVALFSSLQDRLLLQAQSLPMEGMGKAREMYGKTMVVEAAEQGEAFW